MKKVIQHKTNEKQPEIYGCYDTDKGELWYLPIEKEWSCREDRISNEYPVYWYEGISENKTMSLYNIFNSITELITYKGYDSESSFTEEKGRLLNMEEGFAFELHFTEPRFKIIGDEETIYFLEFGSVRVKALGKERKATISELEEILTLIQKA